MPFSILRPGRNVWRIERAERAAVLLDGAAFFGALRNAFLNAHRSIFIVGWDIDSRTRLVGENAEPSDGYSPILVELLSELVETRPDLRIYILLWDFSVIYTVERELFPRLSLQWQTPDRVTLCMDDAVPFGSSQHQKLFVIDDALAFSGGLDLTQRRWDTSDHAPYNPDRIDTDGRTYPPFHDVQMMVDGDAAYALATLARRRWCRAHGTEPPIEPYSDPWPSDVRPDFRQVDIGIARTQPEFESQTPVSEVQSLYLDSIDHAEHSIYIENQFMTSLTIAERIARRLAERPNLELLAVGPRDYKSNVVSNTLGDERLQFLNILKKSGGRRVRLVYPSTSEGNADVDTMVHSKVMIIDDKFLRIGSANLNNRSMRADTECDLAIEARSTRERTVIAGIRNRLLADHCGTMPDAIARATADSGSLIAAAERLTGNGHSLRLINSKERNESSIYGIAKKLIDPRRPLSGGTVWRRIGAKLPATNGLVAITAILFVVLGLTVAWQFTPVAEFVTPERAHAVLLSVKDSALAPLWVIAAYVIAGAVAFPVIILIVATAAAFGPWLGFVYATLGALASAVVMYFAGRLAGPALMTSIGGSRLNNIRREIGNRGVLAVALIRLVPAAPFTLVNLTAGAFEIRLIDYVAGTLIGMLPGLIAISALGQQITALVKSFSPLNIALLVLFIALWGALAWGAQIVASRLRKRAT
jgi:phospholipase D1/2